MWGITFLGFWATLITVLVFKNIGDIEKLKKEARKIENH